MTAEEKLKEWYDACEWMKSPYPEAQARYNEKTQVDSVCILPEHIDLIANLVVERLKDATD